MISHVCVGISDFDRAFSFYSAIAVELGLRLKFCDANRPCAGWMPANAQRPLLVIGAPFDGQIAIPGNGQMLALLAASRDAVARTHAAALTNGGSCEGPPGLRPEYHADYYGGYFRDPDGNKLCVYCHEPAPSYGD